jgi:hypothetical protein
MATNDEIVAGNALAGGAIATAILETLFDKQILTLSESRAVLDMAMKGLGHVTQTPAGFQASQVITALLRGKYSARG